MSKKIFVSFLSISQVLTCGIIYAESHLEAPSVTSLTIAQKPSHAFTPFTGKVKGNKVRLRTNPTLEGFVVREASAGEYLSVVDEKEDFYAVLPPTGTKGYVFRTYVLDNVVEVDRVNIRLYPDMEAPVIGQLHAGEKIQSSVSEVNNKWLEIELGHTSHFYISKEYIENAGPAEMLAQKEARKQEAWHLLSSAFHLAQSEIKKPFEEIDVEKIDQSIDRLMHQYADLPDVMQRAQEIGNIIHDAYLQKKIYFLEFKADRTTTRSLEEVKKHLAKLTKLGEQLQQEMGIANFKETSMIAVKETIVEEAIAATEEAKDPVSDKLFDLTDKMLVWVPFEESLYHMWAASGGEGGMEDFYNQEAQDAIEVTGIVEAYNRPVKNRPGDYLLRADNLPVGFLYSTKVNLQEMVGKKISLSVTPRPNHNFAFPAYFVHSIE